MKNQLCQRITSGNRIRGITSGLRGESSKSKQQEQIYCCLYVHKYPHFFTAALSCFKVGRVGLVIQAIIISGRQQGWRHIYAASMRSHCAWCTISSIILTSKMFLCCDSVHESIVLSFAVEARLTWPLILPFVSGLLLLKPLQCCRWLKPGRTPGSVHFSSHTQRLLLAGAMSGLEAPQFPVQPNNKPKSLVVSHGTTHTHADITHPKHCVICIPMVDIS